MHQGKFGELGSFSRPLVQPMRLSRRIHAGWPTHRSAKGVRTNQALSRLSIALVIVCLVAAISAQGSCFSFASRSGTLETVKWSDRKREVNSSQAIGTLTVAPCLARVE